MYSQPTNIPNLNPGDSLSSRTLDLVSSIVKSASVHTPGSGIHGYSTSSGTSQSMESKNLRLPIWAMITGSAFLNVPNNAPSGCPRFLVAYSWVELLQSFDRFRHGAEIFPVIEDSTLPPYFQVPDQITRALYNRSCRTICGAGRSLGGLYGDLNNYPLFDVHNLERPLGYITQIYHGFGNYMFMVNKSPAMLNSSTGALTHGSGWNITKKILGAKVLPFDSCCGRKAIVLAADVGDDLTALVSTYTNRNIKEPDSVLADVIPKYVDIFL